VKQKDKGDELMRLTHRILVSCAFTVALGASACPADYPEQLPIGSWGGQHIGMVASDTGATIEYDCASGVIAGPLRLGAQGEFDWSGTHFRGHGGPIRVDEVPDAHPARYTGRATANDMTMTLTLLDGTMPPQTFTLARGANAGVFKCL
jgi:hypothetical protein